ncbi:hypothetical protein DB346_10570 [Verrucomicrobia bacterium LW23]|nr:hypothetical protein DB346_10570 [Verrucomicrobia bacterium LW23]
MSSSLPSPFRSNGRQDATGSKGVATGTEAFSQRCAYRKRSAAASSAQAQWSAFAVVLSVMLVCLYPLSVGPVAWGWDNVVLAQDGGRQLRTGPVPFAPAPAAPLGNSFSVAPGVYYPIMWAYGSVPTVQHAMDGYLRLWGRLLRVQPLYSFTFRITPLSPWEEIASEIAACNWPCMQIPGATPAAGAAHPPHSGAMLELRFDALEGLGAFGDSVQYYLDLSLPYAFGEAPAAESPAPAAPTPTQSPGSNPGTPDTAGALESPQP